MTIFMKANAGRTLFGLLLGVAGGLGFGYLAQIVVEIILRSEYNGIYYIENGSALPTIVVALSGLIAGFLVPLVNSRMLRPAVGAGMWLLGTDITLLFPLVYTNLLVRWPVIGACSLVSLVGGAVLGRIAAGVNLP